MVTPDGVAGSFDGRRGVRLNGEESAATPGVPEGDNTELKAALLELSHAMAVAESEKARREAVTHELERHRQLEVGHFEPINSCRTKAKKRVSEAPAS